MSRDITVCPRQNSNLQPSSTLELMYIFLRKLCGNVRRRWDQPLDKVQPTVFA
jgi:hypothetical protein